MARFTALRMPVASIDTAPFSNWSSEGFPQGPAAYWGSVESAIWYNRKCLKTIIEPFRIKSVEPLRYTTREDSANSYWSRPDTTSSKYAQPIY
jgi:hypothetical protein